MNPTADILIIGAGVMGASIAFHLAERGVRNVLVLDKTGVCAGMTKRSGALVRLHYTNEPEARVAFAAFPYFQNWKERVGYDCGFTRTGFTLVVGGNNSEKMQKNVAMLQRVGVNTRLLTPAELKDVQPMANVSDVVAAAHEPDSGYADPVATTNAFLWRALEMGAKFQAPTRVTAIRTAQGRVVGVETDGGAIDAPVVVLCANVWSAPLAATAGVALDIEFHRGQVAFFKRPPSLAQGHNVYIDSVTGSYFRPHGPTLTLIGVGALRPEFVGDPDHFVETNDAEYVPVAYRRLSHRIPDMEEGVYVGGHAGLYDMSPDTRAILDRAPNVDGLYLACGFSGTGFKKSPAVGLGMSQMILDGGAHSLDLRPFRYTRFAENDPITSDTVYEVPADFGHQM